METGNPGGSHGHVCRLSVWLSTLTASSTPSVCIRADLTESPLLLQRVGSSFFHITIAFSLISYPLNILALTLS